MENSKEIWKPVKGYEKRYEVSNMGVVRNKITRQTLKYVYGSGNANPRVFLCANREYWRVSVHRLVYETFKGEIKGNHAIVHIDGDYSNNSIGNLKDVPMKGEYITMKAKTSPRSGLRARKPCYCKESNTVYASCHEAAVCLHLNAGAVSRCVSGYGYQTMGKHFRAATAEETEIINKAMAKGNLSARLSDK